MPENKHYPLLIEKLVPGGFGLGRLKEGIVVLVRYVLPGEEVLVRPVTRKKDYIAAVLDEVLRPSPDRVTPPCPVYGRCGGCDLQHAGADAQIRLKKNILAESLQRAAATIYADLSAVLADPLPSPKQFAYRQRIRLQVDTGASFGFFRAGSHVLEPVTRCLLAGDELNILLQQLHDSCVFGELVKQCSSFELLFNPQENNTVMLLHFRRKPRASDSSLARTLAHETNGLGSLLLQVEGHGLYDPLAKTFLHSPPLLSYTYVLQSPAAQLHLTWEAGAFCQVNLGQNSRLVELVMEMAAGGPHERILDLYCGYGNFSLPAAKLGAEVLGIDGQNSAIRSAKRNALQNASPGCSFERNEAPAAVNAMIATGRTFDTVILDPPRHGAPEIISRLSELGAAQIIYISCNPTTLARDLALLLPAGYTLSRLVPVDMFPQTHHLEAVALLQRRAGRP